MIQSEPLCPKVVGRDDVLASLEAELAEGRTILLHGPLGIGKTALLLELERRARVEGRPCGRSKETTRLSDVTEALRRAYPDAGRQARTQRQLRGALRLAAERRRGSLLLDRLGDVGSAVKGYLRSLRGLGLGVVIAADVEQPRDLARARARRLGYRELAIPPLHGRWMRRLLDEALAGREAAPTIAGPDRKRLLELAAGRPGFIRFLVDRLADPRHRRAGRLMFELLGSEVSMEILRVYTGAGETSVGSGSHPRSPRGLNIAEGAGQGSWRSRQGKENPGPREREGPLEAEQLLRRRG